MDGDADVDLLTVSWEEFGTALVWHENDPDRTTLEWPKHPIDDHGFKEEDRAAGLALADIDNDGHTDIIFATMKKLFLYERIGADEFQRHELVSNDEHAGWITLDVVDFDRDGVVDAILCSRGCWRYPISLPATTSPPEIPLAEESNIHNVQSVAIGDVNKDGLLDLIVVAQGNNQDNILTKVAVFFNNGFSEDLPMTALDTSLSSPAAVALLDYDADSDLDIIVGDPGGDPPEGLVVFENLSHGTFDTGVTLVSGTIWEARGILAMAVGDIGSTQSPQTLITGTGDTHTLAWWDRDLLDAVGSRDVGDDQEGKIWDVSIADVNNDGCRDIIFATEELLAYFESTCPNATTTSPTTLSEATSAPASAPPSPVSTVPPTMVPAPPPSSSSSKKKKKSTTCGICAPLGTGIALAALLLFLTVVALCHVRPRIKINRIVGAPEAENDAEAKAVDDNDAEANDVDITELKKDAFRLGLHLVFRVLGSCSVILSFVASWLLHGFQDFRPGLILSYLVLLFFLEWIFAVFAFYKANHVRHASGDELVYRSHQLAWIFIDGFGHNLLNDNLMWGDNAVKKKKNKNGGLYADCELRVFATLVSLLKIILIILVPVVVILPETSGLLLRVSFGVSIAMTLWAPIQGLLEISMYGRDEGIPTAATVELVENKN